MTVPAKQTPGEIIEAVLIQGDLDKLTPQQRTDYYLRVCESLRLNPLTRPFEYIRLNGKLQLYAKKDATDQLRKINGISVKLVSKDVEDNVLTVHASARDADGREDEDLGTIAFIYPDRYRDRNGNWVAHPKAGQALSADDRANAVLKCVTKSKRRVTLSICGLGVLDESELPLETAPRAPPRAAANVMLATDDEPPPETSAEGAASAGEVHAPASDAEAAPEDQNKSELTIFSEALHKAAQVSTAKLKETWESIPAGYRPDLRDTLERLKPKAAAADAQARMRSRKTT